MVAKKVVTTTTTEEVPDTEATNAPSLAATTVAPTTTAVPLPTWTDAASIASYVTTVIGTILTFITTVHPGFHEPAIVEEIVAPISALIAGGAQIVNVITHRSVQKVAIKAAAASAAVGQVVNFTLNHR